MKVVQFKDDKLFHLMKESKAGEATEKVSLCGLRGGVTGEGSKEITCSKCLEIQIEGKAHVQALADLDDERHGFRSRSGYSGSTYRGMSYDNF